MSSFILLRTQNSPLPLLLWGVIGLCLGVYIFIRGFQLLQRRHLILDTPVSKIRGASMGMVELNGLAAGPYTTVAPITARPCYYYRTLAWEWKQEGKNKRWVKVAAESMHVPFFLDDNTGKVLIDPRGAELDLHRDFQQEFCDGFFTLKQEAPPAVRDFLSRHGVQTHNKIKVEEFCVKPKNALFVLGTLDENHDIELTQKPILDAEYNTHNFNLNLFGGGFSLGSLNRDADLDDRLAVSCAAVPIASHSTQTQVIRLSPDSTPLKAADMTQQQRIAAAMLRAGISSPAAWAAAGVTPAMASAPTSVITAPDSPHDGTNGSNGSHAVSQPAAPPPTTVQPSTTGFENHPSVVLMKGKNNPAFLISWRSQRDLALSMGWKCMLMIWGGPALILLSVYMLDKLVRLFNLV